MPINPDDPRFSEVLVEPFDDAATAFTHVVGDRAGITLRNDGDAHGGYMHFQSDRADGFAQTGLMQFPGGPQFGQGYGLYEFDVRLYPGEGGGPAGLLWQADNQWPGYEWDMLEATASDRQSFFVNFHWAGPNGENLFDWHTFGADMTQWHRLSLDWAGPSDTDPTGRLSVFLDGELLVTTTRNVGLDFSDGGSNEVIGFLVNPGGYPQPGNAVQMDIDNVSYSTFDASAAPEAPPVVAPETPQAAPNDWNMIAAEALRFFAENGVWPSTDTFANPIQFVPVPPLTPVDPPGAEPVEVPVGGGSSGGGTPPVVDWNALAAAVTANFLATGSWGVPSGTPPANPEPPAPGTPLPVVDWNAIAAAVTANFDATGTWFG